MLAVMVAPVELLKCYHMRKLILKINVLILKIGALLCRLWQRGRRDGRCRLSSSWLIPHAMHIMPCVMPRTYHRLMKNIFMCNQAQA